MRTPGWLAWVGVVATMMLSPGVPAMGAAPATGQSAKPAAFRFEDSDPRSVTLWDGDRPVYVYRHGVMLKDGIAADRARSSYLHPIYGLDGEVLTDDFPEDHLHHRGLFWSWPHVGIDGQQYDLWMLKGIGHRFERFLERKVTPTGAVLAVENGWFVGDRKVMQEQVRFSAGPASADNRAIDVECTWVPLDRPISLSGAEGKSYGGMTLRFAQGTNTLITTPMGNGTNDLYMTRLPWADLTRLFDGRSQPSGAALFVPPDHPDFPPTWLTRHYGVLCLGWPGVEARTFPAGTPIHCRYRVWVHRGVPDKQKLESAYAAYVANAADPKPGGSAAAPNAPPNPEVSGIVSASDLVPPSTGTKVLIVTGIDYPGHPWRETAPRLRAILDKDPRLSVRVVEDPNALASPRLKDWDVIVLHFMDWEVPGPNAQARENLWNVVRGGKGLILTHFACGAWDGNEWPDFVKLAGRVWDPKLRGHDPHGKFRVDIADPAHPITRGLAAFETLDELYTCLTGDTPIHVVAKATSKVDGKDYPMAFVLEPGQGRVFHTVLGHDARAYANDAGVGELLRRGCAWAGRLAPVP